MCWDVKPLEQGFTKSNFLGFTLTKGFWYGYSDTGVPVATSTWSVGSNLAVYFHEDGNWKKRWLPYDNCVQVFPEELIRAVQKSNPEFSG